MSKTNRGGTRLLTFSVAHVVYQTSTQLLESTSRAVLIPGLFIEE
jgi:hypothetical protein